MNRVKISWDEDGIVARLRSQSTLTISYEDGSVKKSKSNGQEPRLECWGILGVCDFPNNGAGYVILVTKIREVTDLPGGHHVWVIEDIAIVPLHKDQAKKAIEREIVKLASKDDPDGFSESTDDFGPEDWHEEDPPEDASPFASPNSTIGRNVIQDRGLYGRILNPDVFSSPNTSPSKVAFFSNTHPLGDPLPLVLPPKLTSPLTIKFEKTLRETFTAKTYYFSDSPDLCSSHYNFNAKISSSLPDSYRIIVFQGFVNRISVPVSSPKNKTDTLCILLISKRSISRNGLRYQRRGIDQKGLVANFVETTQLTSLASDPEAVKSFTQIRGSIPLFWKQDPWTLHPVPIIQRTEEANTVALKLHYNLLNNHYGHVTSVDLVNSHGRENILRQKFKAAMDEAGQTLIDWDFHNETAGMQYNNISKLIDKLSLQLKEDSWTEAASGTTQKGVIRTNCMDCLDRTNVIQSSIALRILSYQYPFLASPAEDSLTKVFNTLWADNGDNIATLYTNSPALKGDFTRTGKRQIRGIINDAKNSLRRYYTNIIADFFGQVVLDYLLGKVTRDAFFKFESNLSGTEIEEAQARSDLRKEARSISASLILRDNERLIDGWHLLSPSESDSITSLPMVETQLLFTEQVMYVCLFDYVLEKVTSFKRIEFDTVTKVLTGTYITSTVHPSFTDPLRNVGFVIYYKSVKKSNESDDYEEEKVAFKADYDESLNEKKSIEAIVTRILELTKRDDLLVSGDIIGEKEAKGLSGFMDFVDFRVRSLIWA